MITTWDRIKAFFRDSLTLLWARVQWFGGIISAGLIVYFANYDYTRLTTLTWDDVLKMLGAIVVAGFVTEAARRRTL